MRARISKHSRPGFVRIIGGQWRRRRLAVAAVDGLRPTPDRVRETLFSWLAPVLPGARCLDLFAGTGILGFEALSRGADRAVFVETAAPAVAALEAARDALGAAADVVRDDANRFVTGAAVAGFDIVFVDPPYVMAVDGILDALTGRLRPGARIYLERDRSDPWPATDGLQWLRRGTAGSVAFGVATPLAGATV